MRGVGFQRPPISIFVRTKVRDVDGGEQLDRDWTGCVVRVGKGDAGMEDIGQKGNV